MTIRVLFVCTANICRSPFMEIYARRLAGPDVVVSSAGTYGLDRQAVSEEIVAELRSRGLEADDFRSRPVTAELLADADLVLTAERAHRQFILDDHPELFRKVFTIGQAATAAGTVPDGVRGRSAIDALAAARGTAAATGDVADPYGRGPAAAATAAELIAGMLDQILPLLSETTDPGTPRHG